MIYNYIVPYVSMAYTMLNTKKRNFAQNRLHADIKSHITILASQQLASPFFWPFQLHNSQLTAELPVPCHHSLSHKNVLQISVTNKILYVSKGFSPFYSA